MRRSDFGVVTSLFEESSDRPIAPQKGNECERSVKERKETIWLKNKHILLKVVFKGVIPEAG